MSTVSEQSLPATQAANVESRIAALERLGQHGKLPDYWRTPLALAFSADEVAANALLAENERLHAAVNALEEREHDRYEDDRSRD